MFPDPKRRHYNREGLCKVRKHENRFTLGRFFPSKKADRGDQTSCLQYKACRCVARVYTWRSGFLIFAAVLALFARPFHGTGGLMFMLNRTFA